MLFASVSFAIFLPLVFFLFWFVFNKNVRWQNALTLMAGYAFYAWWDWRFLSLIVISSLTDFLVSRQLGKTNEPLKRKVLLIISLGVNLGLLGFFKYYNFFIESFADAFSLIGYSINTTTLNIIFPLGISFYTFQTMSYSIDVYRGKIQPTDNLLAFFSYVSFFPQLLAGPIERASNLLPQFLKKRVFDYALARDGLLQILWGLFQKVVIADLLGANVDFLFSNQSHMEFSGPTLLLGAVFFAIQIYGDWAGYSNIAIGCGKLFGIRLMTNFDMPLFSRDIAEFWRRWHISLATWVKDYMYIPLGGNRKGKTRQVINITIVFLVIGLWHGPNWTFVLFGLMHCIFYNVLLLSNNQKKTGIAAENSILPSLRELYQIGLTFLCFALSLVMFRADSVTQAFDYYSNMFSANWLAIPTNLGYLYIPILFFIIEWVQRKKKHALQISALPKWLRWPVYYGVMFSVLYYFTRENPFIYFQI
ncbi:MAG: MBOAT family protein [Roseivirga sp.]|nr:MBOAT family protein [Roseivirga sp.]